MSKAYDIAIMIGLLVMMWPILTKGEPMSRASTTTAREDTGLSLSVQYERLPSMARERYLWKQVGISLVLNWIVGPFVRSRSLNQPI